MLNILTVDISGIPYEILLFEVRTGAKPSYCVMTSETSRLISNNNSLLPRNSKNSYMYDVPIAICDNLKLGEVKLV